MIQKRLIVHAKDIQNITGQSERRARSLLSKMRKHYNKERHQYISVVEFCQYCGLDIADVLGMLK
jgi:hypothetical protein